LPETAPAPFQAEASALPRAPQTPLPPVVQEIPPEPEQIPAPVQGIRHEASTCTQICHFLLTNHS
jgi:hypothetical protein